MVDTNSLVMLEQRLAACEDDVDEFDDQLDRIGEMSLAEYRGFLELRDSTEFGTIWKNYRETLLRLARDYLRAPEHERARVRSEVTKFS